MCLPLHPNRFSIGGSAHIFTTKKIKFMINNEEILIRQTECLGMMHELKDDIRSMHRTLYSVKGKLSFSEARKYLGITQTELNALVRDKVIPCTKVSSRRLVFDTHDLDNYLDVLNQTGKEDKYE